MNLKCILLTITCSYAFVGLSAQVKTFRFKKSDPHFAEHEYQSVSVIDGRENKRNIGLVQKGQTTVMIDPSLEEAIQDYLNPLLSKGSGSKKLIIHIRQFSFSELPRFLEVEGYFRIRAETYEQIGDAYLPLINIDTLVTAYGIGFSNNLLREGQRTIYHWVGEAIKVIPLGIQLLTKEDILNIDRIEKQKIPLFNYTVLPKGLYNTYQDLVNLQPNDTAINFQLDEQSGRIRATRIDSKGNAELMRLTNKAGYAVSFDNKIWILVPAGYAIAKFRDGVLNFDAPYSHAAAQAEKVSTYVLFGLVGGLLYSMGNPEEKLTSFMVDHLHGGHIPIR